MGMNPVPSIAPSSTNNALANLQKKHGMANSKYFFPLNDNCVELQFAGAQSLAKGNDRELHTNSELGLVASGVSPESANRAIIQ